MCSNVVEWETESASNIDQARLRTYMVEVPNLMVPGGQMGDEGVGQQKSASPTARSSNHRSIELRKHSYKCVSLEFECTRVSVDEARPETRMIQKFSSAQKAQILVCTQQSSSQHDHQYVAISI